MPDTIHVLCTQPLTDQQRTQLTAVSPRLVVDTVPSRRELGEALTLDTQVLLASWGDFDVARAPGLRWMQTESAGVDHLIDTPVWQSDIVITSANGVHAVQIAEYVLAMLLAHGHHLPTLQRWQQQQVWADRHQREQVQPRELRDRTVGIVGYGAIGREVARLATAFGMRVLATSRSAEPTPYDGWTPAGTGDAHGRLPQRYFMLDQLPEMLAQCDAVVLALPLSPRTQHVIRERELDAMRDDALLINIGRGGLVDQAALVAALQTGRIGGAALDVTDPEPLPPDSPLWQMENVILTPHISGMTPHYTDRVLALFADNLQRYVSGETLFNIVDREAGY